MDKHPIASSIGIFVHKKKNGVIEYDILSIGTGSAMNIISAVAKVYLEMKIAVIDKDEPSGNWLTKRRIPTKIRS